MARDFVQLVDDLAYAKTFYPSSRVTRLINSMASRIYLRIYQNRKEESNRLVRFWKYDVPLTIAKHYKVLLFSAFLFVLFYLLGFLSARYEPGFTREVLGNDYVDVTEKNIREGNPFGIYQSGNGILSWFYLMTHNVTVSLIAFVGGLVAGIFSISALVQNAMMVGVFNYMFFAHGLGVQFFMAVMLHGLLELTSLVIACGAGIVMGTSYFFPGTISRLQAFKTGVKDGVKIVVGVIPVFGMAAFFEGCITGYYKMPAVLNIFLLSLSAAFIIWYFIIYPMRLKRRFTEETVLPVHA